MRDLRVQSGRRWAIVLAGGEGSRLRELTRGADGEAVPKQYCSLRGGPSLLGETLARAASLVGIERVACVVAAEHERYWRRELAPLRRANVVVQPRNRGTAPGVLLPLLSVLEQDPLATVALFPADHFVAHERVLRRSLQRAFRYAESDPHGRLTLLGFTPEHTETQYGWIVPDAEAGGASFAGPVSVRAFVEKPEPRLAEALRARGGVWNSFLVAGRGVAYLDLFARRAPGLVPSFLDALFARADGRAARVAELYEHLVPSDFCRDLLAGGEDRACVAVVPPCGWTDLGDPDRVAECVERHGRASGPLEVESDAPVVLSSALARRAPRAAAIVRPEFPSSRWPRPAPVACRAPHSLRRAGGTGS